MDDDRRSREEGRDADGPVWPDMSEHRAVGSSRWLRRWLRVLFFAVAIGAAVIILYGMVQLFICDFREVVFPGLPRRTRWLCP